MSHFFDKSCWTNSDVIAPDPNPGRFKILRIEEYDNAIVAEIKYLGCTNFEGRKICVYQYLSSADLVGMERIDPHFAESAYSPIARFKPTPEGWKMANDFAKGIK